MKRNSLLALFSITVLTSVALAQPTPPDFTLTVETVGGPTWNAANWPGYWQMSQNPGNPNQWDVVGQWAPGTVPGQTWSGSWEMNLDPDPVVTNGFTLKNETAVTQTYIVTVLLPIAPPLGAPTQLFGSNSLTLSDINGLPPGGPAYATVGTVAGEAIYEPLIDLLPYLPGFLRASPYSFSVFGPFFVDSPPGVNFSTAAGPAISTSIGIRNVFTLTPGDQVSIQSTFVAIPEPASLVLLLLGGVALTRRR